MDYIIQVSDIPKDTTNQEIYNMFKSFGKIRNIKLKERDKYCFVEFYEKSSVKEALQYDRFLRIGYNFLEITKPDMEKFMYTRTPQLYKNRIVVKNLSKYCTWRELKRHISEIVSGVTYVDVTGVREGVVEFERRQDMMYAIRNLNGTWFKGLMLILEEDSRSNSVPSYNRSMDISQQTTDNICTRRRRHRRMKYKYRSTEHHKQVPLCAVN